MTQSTIDLRPRTSPESVPLPPARVLVVDDQAVNVDVLTRVLRAAGIADVHGFTDPLEALERCGDIDPDLVLLDLHMPQLDGLSFLERLHATLPEGTLLPVIVLTADVTQESRRRALSAGAHDFLTKPFDRVDIVLRVRNLLKTRSLLSALTQRNGELTDELRVRSAHEEAAAAQAIELHQMVSSAFAPGALEMHYQPFVDLVGGGTVGAESLARFTCPPPWTPDRWFTQAATVGLGADLELAAVAIALQGLPHLPEGAFLSVNISPSTAMNPRLRELLETVPGEQIVLELTEHAPVHDHDELTRALEPLRARGVRVAVDDTGAGYTSLQHILLLRPEVVKLDIALVRGIDKDPVRHSLASALVRFASEIDALLIAEGIETAEECEALIDLGVRVGQGFHLGRPGPLGV